MTQHTLVSGLARKNPDTGEMEPIAGILDQLEGKVLVLKDFTTILSSDEGSRSAIYGQLRSAYDGYLESGFGTMKKKVSINAKFGFLAGVTHIIDKYHKMQGLLGERFLLTRSAPDPKKAAERAFMNAGHEDKMRDELSHAVKQFIKHRKSTGAFNNPPKYAKDQEEELISYGLYIALMRANVWAQYNSSREIIDMDLIIPEIPTRVVKQLKKIGQLIAINRGHEIIQESDMATLRRVSKDTCDPKRQRIIDAWQVIGFNHTVHQSDLTAYTRNTGRRGLYHKTVVNQLTVMEPLGIVTSLDNSYWRLDKDFLDLLDTLYPSTVGGSKKKPINRLFSEPTREEDTRKLDNTVISLSHELQSAIVDDAIIFLGNKPGQKADHEHYLKYLSEKHKVSNEAVKALLWEHPSFKRFNAWSLKYYP